MAWGGRGSKTRTWSASRFPSLANTVYTVPYDLWPLVIWSNEMKLLLIFRYINFMIKFILYKLYKLNKHEISVWLVWPVWPDPGPCALNWSRLGGRPPCQNPRIGWQGIGTSGRSSVNISWVSTESMARKLSHFGLDGFTTGGLDPDWLQLQAV